MSGPENGFSSTYEAQQNREAKAKTLARHAWRYGLSVPQLAGLTPDVRRAFARDADVNPPSEGSPTWAAAAAALERMFAGANDPRWIAEAPEHDLAGVDKPWNPDPWGPGTTQRARPVAPQGPEPAPEAAGGRESALEAAQRRLRDPEPAPEPIAAPVPEPVKAPEPLPPAVIPDDAPRGWAEAAALGPLPGFHTCFTCPRPAIVATAHVYRCEEHPPQAGEWGARLNFTPNPAGTCPPARCYCARCDTFVAMAPLNSARLAETDRRSR